MNAGWGKGAGSEQSSAVRMKEKREIIHQTRIVLPTPPLGITLDKPWLTEGSVRAPAASTELQHKGTGEEQGLRVEVTVRELIEKLRSR